MLRQILSSEEIQLKLLHSAVRLLHRTAYTVGGWAMKTEATYYEVVETLH